MLVFVQTNKQDLRRKLFQQQSVYSAGVMWREFNRQRNIFESTAYLFNSTLSVSN
jgi:hypothetical protein